MYVWQVPVRVTHWLIALSIAVLSVTGLYIGHPFLTEPGEARGLFVMGWIRTIHLYTAFVFIAAVVARVIWMFTGNRYAHWDKFLPVHASRRRGFWPTTQVLSVCPAQAAGFVGHNPVAGSAYTLVFGLYFLAIVTGLTMLAPYADVGSPLRWFAPLAAVLGGFQTARWIHHIVMWLLLGFTVHHVYSGILVSMIEANGTMESIFSGYKFVPREDLELSPVPLRQPPGPGR